MRKPWNRFQIVRREPHCLPSASSPSSAAYPRACCGTMKPWGCFARPRSGRTTATGIIPPPSFQSCVFCPPHCAWVTARRAVRANHGGLRRPGGLIGGQPAVCHGVGQLPAVPGQPPCRRRARGHRDRGLFSGAPARIKEAAACKGKQAAAFLLGRPYGTRPPSAGCFLKGPAWYTPLDAPALSGLFFKRFGMIYHIRRAARRLRLFFKVRMI